MITGLKLHEFLKKEGIPFEIIEHAKRYTALETAVIEDVPPEAFAKVVMVKVKGKDTMFVIPADRRIDLFKLGYALGTENLHVEEESEFQNVFTDSEKGAMPPLGSLYGIRVHVDVEFENQKEIYFNAGSHKETIKMAMKDYLRVAEAEIGDYSVPKRAGGKKEEGNEGDEVRCG